ncbi:MAG: GntR family transcriptional regulator [Bryobacteraceae bacterium]|nr:GntR family transcriptional regulator [Bryobacteraceae bacterium]
MAPGQALKLLRQYIKDNGLLSGMKLPAERQLATVFDISRLALREAIQALVVLEVLTSRRGDGTYVKSLANLEGGWPKASPPSRTYSRGTVKSTPHSIRSDSSSPVTAAFSVDPREV